MNPSLVTFATAVSHATVGVILLGSGAAKLGMLKSFSATVASYLGRRPIVTRSAQILPVLEGAIGLSLIAAFDSAVPTYAGMALLAAFGGFSIYAIKVGINAPCKCFGSLSRSSLGRPTLTRSFVLLALLVPSLAVRHGWNVHETGADLLYSLAALLLMLAVGAVFAAASRAGESVASITREIPTSR
jgi:hypothetical protein